MLPRVEISDLAPAERRAAACVAWAVTERLPLSRATRVFQALERGEVLADLTPTGQAALPLRAMTLLRNERNAAMSALLALSDALQDEAAVERVIGYLAQRDAVLEAVFVYEAARLEAGRRLSEAAG